MTLFRRLSLLLLGAVATTAIGSNTSIAAPQILGLIASADPLPLNCEHGICATQASSFCLQKWRLSPPAGTTFSVANNRGIRLIATLKDGSQVVVPKPQMSIVASRGHTSVQLSVDVKWMNRRGYQSAAIEIDENVSLIPHEMANDPKPQTARDIKVATGPLRSLGSKMVDHQSGVSGTALGAAKLLNRVASALPKLGRSHVPIREKAWETGMQGVVKASARQIATARGEFNHCMERTTVGYQSLRQCLGSRHDILVGKMNDRYWAATDQNM